MPAARRGNTLARFMAAARRLVARPVAAARRRRRHGRVQEVERAAAEAAEDHERFVPERVRSAAEELFREVQQSWDDRDVKRLATLLGADLLEEWERRLADFREKGWRSRVEVLGDVHVDYVGLANHEGEAEDRVVVLIEATLSAYVEDGGRRIYRKGQADAAIGLCQFWTLGLRVGRWTLYSIEERAEGEHHLAAPIVASPWSAGARLRDEAVIETSTADELPAGIKPADLADLQFDGDARIAALDLSLADPRFAPEVLEAAARRAVEAWAEAIDGSDAALAQLASAGALRELLHDGDDESTRLVVRGPRIRHIEIVAIDAAAEPPAMTIEIQLSGQHYVEDRATAAVLSGSRERATTFVERWTLSLEGSQAHPWRITAAGH